MLDAVEEINRQTLAEVGDPETNSRIAQYEMAFRMQSSVPELTDLSKEPESLGNCTVRKRKSRNIRLQLPARAAHGRTRRSLHANL